jgi:hypothetical protein
MVVCRRESGLCEKRLRRREGAIMIRRGYMPGFAVAAPTAVYLRAFGLVVLLFVSASCSESGYLATGPSMLARTSVPTRTPTVVSRAQPTAISLPPGARAPTDNLMLPDPLGPQSRIQGVAVEEGYSLSIEAVEDPAKPGIDLWYYPKPGAKRIAVEITVGCVACKEATVHPIFVILVDTEGSSHMAELGPLIDYDEITATGIGPGEFVTGWVVFEVPDAAAPAYVKYLFAPGITLQARIAK